MAVAQRSSSALRILLVDRDAGARSTLKSALESRIARPMMILETDEVALSRTLATERDFDVVALDLETAGSPDVFADFLKAVGSVTTYAMGPRSAVREAVAVVQAGAADFIEKPIDGPAFARRIERQFVGVDAQGSGDFEGITGRSRAMLQLYEQIGRIAPSPAPVFIFGESGTGKSLAARAVHARSRQRSAAFVTVDCAGVEDAMLIDRLAAPGGAIERAEGGTLFLDEVGRLGDAVQGFLLRFLGSSDAAPVMGGQRLPLRIISSSNRPMGELAAPGGLRPDLFFRLNVLTLSMPPLRERGDDIAVMLEDHLRRTARQLTVRPPRLTEGALKVLSEHDWPGNVRELANFAERAVLRADGTSIDAAMAAALIGRAAMVGGAAPVRPGVGIASGPQDIRPLWMEEERIIEAAIDAFGGNIARAAAALEISPSTIYRKRRPGAAPMTSPA